MPNAMIEIVWDWGKRKLRAKPVGHEGWIRFPKHLRVAGAEYMVDELREGKAGSWIAVGEIREVSKSNARGSK